MDACARVVMWGLGRTTGPQRCQPLAFFTSDRAWPETRSSAQLVGKREFGFFLFVPRPYEVSILQFDPDYMASVTQGEWSIASMLQF